MTEPRDLEKDKYKSLKEIMDESKTVTDFDRRVNGATPAQIRLYNEYKKLKEEQQERRHRPRKYKSSFVVRGGHRFRVFRDRRGRFTKQE